MEPRSLGPRGSGPPGPEENRRALALHAGVSDGFEHRRERMVRQLRTRGISWSVLLDAFMATPRHLFVDEALADRAYGDASLPLGLGQTLSQPYIVARMIDLLELRSGDRVLEIGTGSGYQSALLSYITGAVFTVERLEPLARRAAQNWRRAGARGIEQRVGDGSLGWPEAAPFAAILVSAAAPEVPQALLQQLAPGGRMVVPVGSAFRQRLKLLTRTEVGALVEDHEPCAFVRLVGRQGFAE